MTLPEFVTVERTRRKESEAALLRLQGELMAKTGKPPAGWVPHEALHAERQRRRNEVSALNARIAELEAEVERLRSQKSAAG
jgi:hypothetical protein